MPDERQTACEAFLTARSWRTKKRSGMTRHDAFALFRLDCREPLVPVAVLGCQECADGDLLQQINKCKQERAYLREAGTFGTNLAVECLTFFGCEAMVPFQADIWRYLDGMCQGLKATLAMTF